MIETFTSKFTNNIAKDRNMCEDLSLNAEEKLFYAMLEKPLDDLLKQPSSQSIEFILTFSKTQKQSHN